MKIKRGVNKKSWQNKKYVFKKYKIKKMHIVFWVFCWLVIVGLFNIVKPLPQGISYEGELFEVSGDDVHFLYDLTYETDGGERIYEQEIFDEVFSMIEDSEEFILVDMFLYNDFEGETKLGFRNLSSELTRHLIEKKEEFPSMDIIVITDPINVVYGGFENEQMKSLSDAGVEVVYTDVGRLRDSNPIYSSFYRTFLQWFGNSRGGFMSHPFSDEEDDVSIRSYLRLANFKANHRKTILCDDGEGGAVSLVMSANPHDGSAVHSNVALRVDGLFAQSLYESELAVYEFSEGEGIDYSFRNNYEIEDDSDNDNLRVQILTESKILDGVIASIDNTSKGDKIKLGMFYFSHRGVIESLIDAANRGVDVEIIIDPNKDAFGYEKGGIPNRQVAYELLEKTDNKIKIRWYDTNGEQFHTKLLYIKKKDGSAVLILGSANYTRRNLDDYNLESNVKVEGLSHQGFFVEVEDYWERIWFNDDGVFTVDYSEYEDESSFKRVRYRFEEFTGLCTY